MLSPSPLCLFLLFLILASTHPSSATEYLKLPLLHRTPNLTPFQALSFDTQRLSLLHRRRHHRASSKSPVISGAASGSGQYFVSLSLGSPSQTLLLVADTGSDLIWVRCSACRANCSGHSPGSAFLARHSTTFSPAHCFNSLCQLVPHPEPSLCNHTRLHSPCRYEYAYSDGSVTGGFFSTETASLNTSEGRLKKLPGLAFGCGFSVSGPSVTGPSFNGAHGVMGLGQGPISFPSQLGPRFGNAFSYCLMDYTLSPPPTSYLMIGRPAMNGVVPGQRTRNVSFTPLLSNPLSPTFYYIGIKSVSVDGKKLRISPSVWAIDEMGNGGTIVDSGTTLTFLAEPAYRQVLAAFRRRVKLRSPGEPSPGFDLCVNTSGESRRSLRLPRLSFELTGGSALAPPARNYFIETSEGVTCLAIQPVNSVGGFSVLGNLIQQGYLFEFDRDRSRLGFSRHGCALSS